LASHRQLDASAGARLGRHCCISAVPFHASDYRLPHTHPVGRHRVDVKASTAITNVNRYRVISHFGEDGNGL
jgi:hypothetical protein